MRISLAPPRTTTADLPAPPLLDPAGAQVILGGFNDVLREAADHRPTARTPCA